MAGPGWGPFSSVATVARFHLAGTTVSSAASERVFSAGGRINTTYRTRLAPDVLSSLMLVRMNDLVFGPAEGALGRRSASARAERLTNSMEAAITPSDGTAPIVCD